MPDIATHFYFGERVLSSLPAEARERLDERLFGCFTAGPDVWVCLGFYGGRNKAKSERGGIMHAERTGAFLRRLTEEARSSTARDELWACLAGHLCHYCLDKNTHPYIVCKTGDYDGTEATRQFRGDHTRLERAIDSAIIRAQYGETPRRFRIPHRVIRIRRLPACLRAPLDAIYAAVYGWGGAFDDLNAAVRDERLLYALLRDPLGLFDALAGRLDDGRGPNDYRSLSYHRKDIDPAALDYMNERHAPWSHPNDPLLVSTESFPELFERARQETVDMLTACRAYVYGQSDELPAALLGNCNYSTGFACDDPRNAAPPRYELLFHGKKPPESAPNKTA